MNMFNNLPQQAPAYYYAPQTYQRQASQVAEMTAPVQPTYTQPLMMQPNYIKGRPVVSIDEARASQIDLDGSLYVFPDLGNKKIYTKQINMDGTAAFNIFELSGAGADQSASTPVYVTKDELDEILASFKESLIQEKHTEAGPAPKPQTVKTFNL